MNAIKVNRIVDWDEGDSLIVRGSTDPNEILAAARDELGSIDDGMVVTTTRDQVRVNWWRVNPCREGYNCDERHLGHFTEVGRKTRGGFLAAEIHIGWPEEADRG